jgi:hypothetical protein
MLTPELLFRKFTFRRNVRLFLWIALFGLAFLLVSQPFPVLADGGGPESAGTPTPSLTPTGIPPTPGPTSAYPKPENNTANIQQPNATAAPAADTGGGLPMWPLGLLLLAILAFGAIAFILFRKK